MGNLEELKNIGKSQVGNGIILVRGHDIRDIVREFTFEDSVFYQVLEASPTAEQISSLRNALIDSGNLTMGNNKYGNFTDSAISSVFDIQTILKEDSSNSEDSIFPREVDLLIPLLHHLPIIASHYSSVDRITQKIPISYQISVYETFEQFIFKTMLDRMPKSDSNEERMIQAYLVSLCEHADTSPSTPPAQIVSNLRGNFYRAITNFMSTADSPYHFGALPRAMNELETIIDNRNDLKDYLMKRLEKASTNHEYRIWGLGHRYHKTNKSLALSEEELARLGERIDPRVDILFELSDELGFGGKYMDILRESGEIIYSEKKLPINVDGAGAAILKDMGFLADTSLAFVYMGRSPMIARYHLEQLKEKPNTLWKPAVVEDLTVSRDITNKSEEEKYVS